MEVVSVMPCGYLLVLDDRRQAKLSLTYIIVQF